MQDSLGADERAAKPAFAPGSQLFGHRDPSPALEPLQSKQQLFGERQSLMKTAERHLL
jgi:hypothetical protein